MNESAAMNSVIAAGPIKILVAALVSFAIQFGLAIRGWGGWDPFFAHRQFQALFWVCVALGILAMFTGSSGLSSGEKEDKSNRWVLGAFTVISLLMSYLSAWTDRIGFWTIDGDSVRWIGVALCAGGGILRLFPVFVLKERFSGLVAIQAGHKLETTGIYGVVRNPSYLGLIISAFGWGLAFRSGVGVILAISLLIPLISRIRAEEELLHAQFGAEYDAYCAHTWRLAPWVY
jgi:protein-S-isoprenylcysteine O-methyltransferase Ste14